MRFFDRPCTGELECGDPQRKLKLQDPTLQCGNVPSGFIGYAANMINIDTRDMNISTASGYGLRETLFYRLFGELQVYDTKEHMNEAGACIKHGAVSLDGGINRVTENGIMSLGCWYVSLFHSHMQTCTCMWLIICITVFFFLGLVVLYTFLQCYFYHRIN